MYFTNVTWLQEVWEYSPQRSGLAYVAGPVVASVVSIKAGQALKRRSSVQVVVGGTVLFGATTLGFNLVASDGPQYWTQFLPMIVMMGAAVGAVIPVLSGAANAYLPANRFAMGSALYTTGRQVGAALGIAIVSAIQLAAPGQAGLHRSYWYVTAVVLAAGAVMLVSYRQPTESQLAASVAS